MAYRDFFDKNRKLPVSDICLTGGIPNRTAFEMFTKAEMQVAGTMTFLLVDDSFARERKGDKYADALLKYVASELPKELPAFRLSAAYFAVFAPEENVRSIFAGNETVKAITISVDTDDVSDWNQEIEAARLKLETAMAVSHQASRSVPEFFRETEDFLPSQLFWSATVRLTVLGETVTAYVFPLSFPETDASNPMLPFVCAICHDDGRVIPLIADTAARFGVKGERFILSCFFLNQRGVGLQLLLEAESEDTDYQAEFEYSPGRFVPVENGLHKNDAVIYPLRPAGNGMYDAVITEGDRVTVTQHGKAALDGNQYFVSKDMTGFHLIKEE